MIATTLAVALLAALPIGAVRVLSWLLRTSERPAVPVAAGGGGVHVHVWRGQLRWRDEELGTFEDGEVCSCGLWRQPRDA